MDPAGNGAKIIGKERKTMIDAKQSFLSQVRKRAAEELVALVEDALEE